MQTLEICGGNSYQGLNESTNFHSIAQAVYPPAKTSFNVSTIISYSIFHHKTIVVTNDGNAYGIGYNNDGEVSNSFPKPYAKQFTKIELMDAENRPCSVISAVTSSTCTLYMITENNDSNHKMLAFASYCVNTQFPIILDIGDRIPVGIFAGGSSCAAIDEEGAILYVYNSYDFDNKKIEPVFLPNYEAATSIAWCNNLIFALGSTGKVFWTLETKNLSFREVPELKGKEVVCISGTFKHCIAVTKDEHVFAYGVNTNGELGLGQKVKMALEFTEVLSLRDKKIVLAYAGLLHSIFQSSEGKLFTCGNNYCGTLLIDISDKPGQFEPVETEITNVSFCIAGSYASAFFKNYIPENMPNRRIDAKKLIQRRSDQTNYESNIQSHQNNVDELHNQINRLQNEVSQKQLTIEQKDEEINELNQIHQNEIRKLQNAIDTANQELEKIKSDFADSQNKLKIATETNMQEEMHEEQIKELRDEYEDKIKKQQEMHEEQIKELQDEYEDKIKKQQEMHEEQFKTFQNLHEDKIINMQKETEKQIKELQDEYENKIKKQQEMYEEQIRALKEECKCKNKEIGENEKKEEGNLSLKSKIKILDSETVLGLEKLEKIGSGNFGKIYKVAKKEIYALKVMKVKATHKNFQQFLNEYEIISMLLHPNIVKTDGIFLSDEMNPPSILLEYCPQSLEEAIINKKFTNVDLVFSIYQIMEGMKYVHFNHVIHRDLKPTNILIAKDGTIKISDFGIAKLMSTEEQSMTCGMGTQKFMAPEIIDENTNYDEKVDVYSFGVLMYFILSGGEMPKIKMSDKLRGEKAPIPQSFSDLSRQLIDRCWNFEAKCRPSFDQLINEIERNNYNLVDLSESELNVIKSLIKQHKEKILSY